jgi:hypothetical protein
LRLAFERLTDKKLKITDFRAVGKIPLFPQNEKEVHKGLLFRFYSAT